MRKGAEGVRSWWFVGTHIKFRKEKIKTLNMLGIASYFRLRNCLRKVSRGAEKRSKVANTSGRDFETSTRLEKATDKYICMGNISPGFTMNLRWIYDKIGILNLHTFLLLLLPRFSSLLPLSSHSHSSFFLPRSHQAIKPSSHQSIEATTACTARDQFLKSSSFEAHCIRLDAAKDSLSVGMHASVSDFTLLP